MKPGKPKTPVWKADAVTGKILLAALCLWLLAGTPAARAQTADLVDRSALRVCADPANMPFSNRKRKGFENKLADLLGEKLGVPVLYTWFPQATGFIRQTLRARKCDIVMGYAQGHELVQNTNHYYRSAYVLLYPSDSDLAGVERLGDPRLKNKSIGIIAGTPPATVMAQHGLIGRAKPFHLMVDRRFSAPAEQMVAEIVSGELDAGILWGPIAGYYTKESSRPLSLVPLTKELGGPRMAYRITMGIRPNEPDWKHQLNDLIAKHQAEINALLMDFGVPLLDEHDNLIRAAGPVEPEDYRRAKYRAPTPATLKGATVIDTAEALRLWEAEAAVFVDVLPRTPKPSNLPEGTVWRDKPRRSIPGGVWLPNVGYGALNPTTEAYFRNNLARLAEANPDRALVIYCQAACWMSWNAAKRALSYGHSKVYWYPEGTDGWEKAGARLEESQPVSSGS